MNTNLRSKFRLIAWGFTIQLILAVLLLIVYFTSDFRHFETVRTVAIITMVGSLIGTLLCIVGSFSMTGDLNVRKIPTTGAILCGISFSINFILGLVGQGSTLLPISNSRDEGVAIVVLILSLASVGMLVAGVTMLSRYVRGLHVARNGYYTILIAFAILFLVVAISSGSRRSSAEVVGVFAIICFLAMLVGYIMVISGWWASVTGATEIDEYNGEEGEAESEVVNTTTSPYSSTPSIEVLRASLRKLDDQQLKYVVDNPTGYQPAYVEEAKSMLVKRQEWENLQVLTDEKLLEMVNSGTTGGYTTEQCDVASMILFTRKSPLFTSQFVGLSYAQLNAIVNNPGNYYEGYIAQAKELLK